MKLASIVPMKYVDKTFDGDYAMMLAHLADYYNDLWAYMEPPTRCYKIMDNSLIELGGAVDMETLMAAAEKCKPDEIILPDVYMKGLENFVKIIESIRWLEKHNMLGRYRLMAVCHGADPIDFAYWFHQIKEIPEITCIGIPKVTGTFTQIGGRVGLEWLWQTNCTKQIHLLGCWKNLKEFTEYKNPQLIRSCDTCIPALLSHYTDNAFHDRPDFKTIDLVNDTINTASYAEMLRQLKGEGIL